MHKNQRPHIGVFGRRNTGKSALINALANQDVAIVSAHAGTTTDPVNKAIEIPEVGPVVFIDTAGIDDEGELGEKRVQRTLSAVMLVDLAILVIAENEYGAFEETLIGAFKEKGAPFFVVHNKSDIVPLLEKTRRRIAETDAAGIVDVSVKKGDAAPLIIARIKQTMPESAYASPSLMGDLVSKGSLVLLIVPLDKAAPEGRLILPQVMAIRDLLNHTAVAVVAQKDEAQALLQRTDLRFALVVTDSQIFEDVLRITPENIPLTSFSVLMARYKGGFEYFLEGTPAIDRLNDGDRVLILESCSHHSVDDDIGREKIPRWLSEYTKKDLRFDVASGLDRPPKPIETYALVVQCGGCMITRKQVMNRLMPAIQKRVPVTNYGMAIAYVKGMFARVTAMFKR